VYVYAIGFSLNLRLSFCLFVFFFLVLPIHLHFLTLLLRTRKVAFESVDEDGKNMRSCVEVHENRDSGVWADPIGNGCAWYQETRKTVPDICSTPEIKEKCPVACDTPVACFQKKGSGSQDTNSYAIWNRVMHLREQSLGAGVVCVQEGLDAVAQCRKTKQATTPPNIPRQWPSIVESAPNRTQRDIKLDDCDALERAIYPACSFPALSPNIKAEIKQNRGMTISFWWKTLSTTKISNTWAAGEGMKRILFLSKMSPLQVLAGIDFSQDRPAWAIIFGTCDGASFEDINTVPPSAGYKLETGVWYRTTLAWGAENEEGKVTILCAHQ
jgi:hypothetical protein